MVANVYNIGIDRRCSHLSREKQESIKIAEPFSNAAGRRLQSSQNGAWRD
jgi:hypothetical protein